MEAVALASPDERVLEMAEVERLKVNPSGAREKVAAAPADAPLLPLNELQLELPGVLSWGEGLVGRGSQRVLTLMEAAQTGNKNGAKKSEMRRRDLIRSDGSFLDGFSFPRIGCENPHPSSVSVPSYSEGDIGPDQVGITRTGLWAMTTRAEVLFDWTEQRPRPRRRQNPPRRR